MAIVRLYGPIAGGPRTADWIELVRRLRESARVPAVVLDIDSPGGSATASDDMFLALERLAAKKPVVAAIRGTGASGSYLAAMAASRIVAQPHAVVGSIGVISAGPRLPRLLERLGVSVSENRAGRLKGMGAPWRDETDEERAKELRPVKRGVESAGGEQRGVVAALHDPARGDDEDLVRLPDRRESVGDDDRRAPRELSSEGFLDRDLGLRVEGAVASSSTTMSCALSSSRAMAIRCFSPPESR